MTITGIFGMNLTSGLERWDPYSLWALVGGGAAVAALISAVTLRYVRTRGLLTLPKFRAVAAAALGAGTPGGVAGGGGGAGGGNGNGAAAAPPLGR
jgi:hypothetical protein